MATALPDIGRELYNRGWRQGRILRASEMPLPIVFRLLPAAARPTRATKRTTTPKDWNLGPEIAGEDDYLLIVSQDCDIDKPPEAEPHIEVLRATFRTESGDINTARGKSYHYRLLGLRDTDGGGEEGLIADAAWRAVLDKESLLSFTPVFYTPPRCIPSLVVLQKWLGDRFSRMALPNDVVEAVQRPLVKAVRKLNKNHRLHVIMAKIDFVLCVIQTPGTPMEVELWLVVDEDGEDPSLPWAEASELMAWIDAVLVKAGTAKVAGWERYTTDMLSFREFNSQYLLDLDQFSAEE